MDPERARALSPPPGGHRPTTAERDKAIDRLSAAFAAGSIEVEEFERRVTRAHVAESAADLQTLVSDLPAPADQEVPASTRALVPASQVRPHGQIVTVFGSVERRGEWTVPRQAKVVTVFGSGELDFREARFPPGIIEVRVVAVFGSVEIIVPPHLAVEAEGAAIFGSFEHLERSPRAPSEDAPVLRIQGVTVFGSVEIQTRLAGESPHRRR